MEVVIGSARHDEYGRYIQGKPGDGLQKSSPDFTGEVSMQPMYVAKKKWNVIRAKDGAVAFGIAAKMKAACNNTNIGYSQSDRYGIIKSGINTTKPVNCDCSSLVRQCVKEASGKDSGDFTTANAASVLTATGLFQEVIPYKTSVVLYTGDILCTRTKGHIVVVTDGNARQDAKVYSTVKKESSPVSVSKGGYCSKYNGTSVSLVEALKSLGIDSSMDNRKKLASANGIVGYQGSMQQNLQLLSLLKQGRLKCGSGGVS